MTSFQEIALAGIGIWLVVVAIWFRRSTVVLAGGLVAVGVFSAAALARGDVTLGALGLSLHMLWPRTIGFAIGGLVVMLAYSPVADLLATRLVAKPPTLGAFRGLKDSLVRLFAGILIAWALGGVLEELAFRGLVVRAIAASLTAPLGALAANSVAVIAAALGAGIVHLYQGPRAALIITQLSILFGVVFVASGYDLWAVMLCHGLYDTIAFVRFARGTSKYSKFAENDATQ